MLERLVLLRWEVGAVLSESGGDPSFDLSPDQWKLAEMLIPVLRDLEETTRELSGERYATLSMLLPLMHFLRSELACAKNRGEASCKVPEDRTSEAAENSL